MRRKWKNPFAADRRKDFSDGYDYSSPAAREETVRLLLHRAAEGRRVFEEYWRRMRAYYDGEHEIAKHNAAFARENDIPWQAAQSTDGYIHVESQIDAALPDFEFLPRGDDDAEKVRQRERVVRYITERNDLAYKNARNERRLGVLGTAVWKVCWDDAFRSGGLSGEVMIDAPRPQEIYPDPVASSVDECEYIGYVYRMHKEKVRRLFGKELAARGIALAALTRTDGEDVFDPEGYAADCGQDTVRVTEWWFRQKQDGEEDVVFDDGENKRTVHYAYKAGDVALCILLGGCEVRYIPKYWKNTGFTSFPFVLYDRIPRDRSLWGKSELEAILPFIDAADREIAFAQLNAAFCSNDIIVAEENALCDDASLDNAPGAIWKLRPGMMGKIQRLGNTSYQESYLHANYDKWRRLMEETTGNFNVNQGNEPQNVTTATGIALLNERSKNRGALKRIDKSAGFSRLYELCDKTALEYYDDGRIRLIGAASPEGKVFRAADYLRRNESGDVYLPEVDVRVRIGDGLAASKAFTLSAVGTLMNTAITADNYPLVKSYMELVDLPMRKEICDKLEETFGTGKKRESAFDAAATLAALLGEEGLVNSTQNTGSEGTAHGRQNERNGGDGLGEDLAAER